MNFQEAHALLLEGKKICRKEWADMSYLQLIDGHVRFFRREYVFFNDNPDFLLVDDWMIVDGDGDGTKLSFPEALNVLRAGHLITRESMKNTFLFVDNGILALSRPVHYDCTPTYQCFCATDWETVK